MTKYNHLLLLTIFLPIQFGIWASCNSGETVTEKPNSTTDSLFIDHVWTGHPVGFALLTAPPHQFVAYYDSTRAMIVAQRQLGETNWKKKQLPETIGWDSHNYISLVLDSKGYLHVSGNMHVDPLVYFQATKPYDVASLVRRLNLIGDLEQKATYPHFFDGPDNDLIFTYRDGGSGNGNQIYNRYDPDTGTWTRLLDDPLLDGQGDMNAYLHGPVLGPDEYYHLIWVWRDTPDASTNHDISYARSKDLVHWEQSDGSPQPLPITIENSEIIDPVPVQGGMINGNTVIGFDADGTLVVSYHKFDEQGNTQIYNARRETNGWNSYVATDWDFRWDFGGRGSIGKGVGLSPVRFQNGMLTQQYFVDSLGWRNYRLDPRDLHAVEQLPMDKGFPEQLEAVRSAFPGMEVHLQTERVPGEGTYVLRWETLSRNRDLPREAPLPPPGELVLYHFPIGGSGAQ
ncbi:MAG: BNR repeat-containing protein [Saprospiraceae bacterium]